MFQHAENAVKLYIADFEWTENEDCQPFEHCVCDANKFIHKFKSLLKPQSENENVTIPKKADKRPLATAVVTSSKRKRKEPKTSKTTKTKHADQGQRQWMHFTIN